jgi:hypothetical protein
VRDHDLLGRFIGFVVDQVSVSANNELPHLLNILPSTDVRE